MANIIGFKEDVDRYYRHYNQDGSWARALAGVSRDYNAYNLQQNRDAEQANLGVLNYTQSEVSKLYGQYQQGRAQVASSGLTGAVKSQVEASYNSGTGAATKATAGSIISQNAVTPEYADISKDPLINAYSQEVAGTSTMTSDLFEFVQGSLFKEDGTQYTVDDLINDGYMKKVGDGYELTGLGMSKISELTADGQDGSNAFEQFLRDKYGDDYDPQASSYYLQQTGGMLGSDSLSSGVGPTSGEVATSVTDVLKSVDLPKYPDLKVAIGGRIDPNEELGIVYKIQNNSAVKDMTFTDNDGNVITMQQAIASGRYDNITFRLGDDNNEAYYYIRGGKVYIIYDGYTPSN